MAIEWLTVVVSITGLLAIPALVMVIRLAMRWKGIEDRQKQVIDDAKKVVDSTDKQISSLDRRVRWLEENLWKERRPRSPKPPLLPFCYLSGMVLLPAGSGWLVGCCYAANRTSQGGHYHVRTNS